MLEAHPLSQSLKSIWLNYKRQLYLTRKKISSYNIHHLRIEIRKMEAALILVGNLISEKRLKKIIKELRKTRKVIGPLRNIQLGKKFLCKTNSGRNKKMCPKSLVRFMSKEINHEKKKSQIFLKKISVQKQETIIDHIEKRLFQLEETKSFPLVKKELYRSLNSTLLELKETALKIEPNDIDSIHRFRIQAKKFRYQKEYSDIVYDPDGITPPSFKAIQERLGTLLDTNFLKEKVIEYLNARKVSHKGIARKMLKNVTDQQVSLSASEIRSMKIQVQQETILNIQNDPS